MSTRHALTAANLASDFGPRDIRCRNVVRALDAALMSGHGPLPEGCERSVFALQTYYAAFIALLTRHPAFGDARMFADIGAFGWYRTVRSAALEEALAALSARLDEYEAGPAVACAGDLLKSLYHQLFPREIRHALGEYYTPDWLAESVIRQTLGTEGLGDPQRRVLDPACGSGTFLVKLIAFIRERAAREKWSAREVLPLILRNVVGIDINPLAVMAARANYLFAVSDLRDQYDDDPEIPVYHADSILAPECVAAPFDFVVGNPPWVNWERLPGTYRRATSPLWERYGLFPKVEQGMRTILGGAKYDLSMLMTYVALDRYLASRGRLGFVLTQSAFKTGAGRGFRRFVLPDGTPFAPLVVEDLVELDLFSGAAARAAVAVFEKGQRVEYPVLYRVWKKHSPAVVTRALAQPVNERDITSSWISASETVLDVLRLMAGPSAYVGRKGVTASAQGVFWFEVLETQTENTVRVTNVTGTGKISVAPVRTVIEDALLYPLLRGRDVSRWRAEPRLHILLTHEPGHRLRAIPENEMSARFPQAWRHLEAHRDLLRKTGIVRRFFKSTDPFYSMFNIGDYTFRPNKVLIREIAGELTAAVVGPTRGRPIIPDHKLLLVDTGTSEEAHYLCALLNSMPARCFAASYSISTQFSAHLFGHLRMGRFDPHDPVHRKLADASQAAHKAAAAGDAAGLARIESEIDSLAGAHWNLTPVQLAALAAK
jgi:methylase of polypeptide subunit release factors